MSASTAPGSKAKVLYNVGGTLAFEAPQGRPSSDGTCTLYDPRYALTDTAHNPITPTGTATRSTVTGTISNASGKSQSNPKRVTCTPPAGLSVGDFVVLTNASGQSERVEVAAKSASYFDAAFDLALDYPGAGGDTFASAVMTGPAVPSSFYGSIVNIGEDYIAEWSYTVAGVPYVVRTRWDLVREITDSSVFDSDLFARYPELRNFTFADHPGTFAPQMKQAQLDVEATLIAGGYSPTKIRGNELMRFLVLARTARLVALNAKKPNGMAATDFYQRIDEEWRRWEDRILGGTLRIPYDDNRDDVVTENEKRYSTAYFIK